MGVRASASPKIDLPRRSESGSELGVVEPFSMAPVRRGRDMSICPKNRIPSRQADDLCVMRRS